MSIVYTLVCELRQFHFDGTCCQCLRQSPFLRVQFGCCLFILNHLQWFFNAYAWHYSHTQTIQKQYDSKLMTLLSPTLFSLCDSCVQKYRENVKEELICTTKIRIKRESSHFIIAAFFLCHFSKRARSEVNGRMIIVARNGFAAWYPSSLVRHSTCWMIHFHSLPLFEHFSRLFSQSRW